MSILHEEWDACVNEISMVLTSVKKPKDAVKKAQKLQQRILLITNNIREKYFRMYFDYCKNMFLIRYLHWR
jgi:hypothetical protein